MITHTTIITDTSGTTYESTEDINIAVLNISAGLYTVSTFINLCLIAGRVTSTPTLLEGGGGVHTVLEWDDDAWLEFLDIHNGLTETTATSFTNAGWTVTSTDDS